MEKLRYMMSGSETRAGEADKREIGGAVESVMREPPEKALDALRERRLARLSCRKGDEVSEIYVFLSKERYYLMLPKLFCSCKDFELGVVLRRSKGTCYHLVALEIALAQGKLRDVEVDCDTLEDIVLEVLLMEDSPTLRRVLHVIK